MCAAIAAENTGYVEVPLIQALAPACKAAGKAEPEIPLYDNNQNCIQAILAGRADTYVNDVNTVDSAVKAYPDKLEKATAVSIPYSVGIAVPKGKPEFRDAVMAALVTLQKAGIHTELLKKHGMPVENLEVPRLLAWIDASDEFFNVFNCTRLMAPVSSRYNIDDPRIGNGCHHVPSGGRPKSLLLGRRPARSAG